MLRQGVATVEYELQASRKETAILANHFSVPDNGEEVDFGESIFPSNTIRMVYVSPESSLSSDGRRRDVSKRQDIVDAFKGETSFYGPFFNEEKEYVICYSAPVYRNNEIAGVLSIEKDGYYFSSLIQNIRFIDSGKSYIINEQGTDIAVSNQQHLDLVNKQYNAGNILAKQEDDVTRTILELEQKGLDGERGTGSYYWDGGLCYLVYEPIPSAGWVLLAGFREEEIFSMIHSAMFASLTKGSALGICILIFLLFSGAILFRIVSSLKQSASMNKRLEIIAHYDPLTGLLNRTSYQNTLNAFSSGKNTSVSCVYIDVNGLHEINNHLGHQAGDNMLRSVAATLQCVFAEQDAYRIGGDEFVVFCQDWTKEATFGKIKTLKENLKAQGYEISIGIAWGDKNIHINELINTAEEAMRQDKQRYYRDNGKERQIRSLNQELEKMILEKQDADTFLSILAPGFKGVYFVNLDSDSIRHLYIPPYFEAILKEENYLFSKSLSAYAGRYIMPEYRQQFNQISDYDYLKTLLSKNQTAELVYQKTNEDWVKLQILKFKTYSEQNRETLWIFSAADATPPPPSPEDFYITDNSNGISRTI